MNRIDFEPSNSYMLKTKMLSGNSPRNRFDKKKLIKKHKKPILKISSIKGKKEQYSQAKKNYPMNMEKKIFGMRPKTLAVALGVIVVGIILLNMSGNNMDEAVNNNGLVH